MDLGFLVDNCSWYEKWQFSADIYQKLLQTKTLKIFNSHTVPQHSCINFRSFSTL